MSFIGFRCATYWISLLAWLSLIIQTKQHHPLYFYQKTVCQGYRNFITCNGKSIYIINAYYGRKDTTTCWPRGLSLSNWGISEKLLWLVSRFCHIDVKGRIENLCGGETSLCSLLAMSDNFTLPCKEQKFVQRTVTSYLSVLYECRIYPHPRACGLPVVSPDGNLLPQANVYKKAPAVLSANQFYHLNDERSVCTWSARKSGIRGHMMYLSAEKIPPRLFGGTEYECKKICERDASCKSAWIYHKWPQYPKCMIENRNEKSRTVIIWNSNGYNYYEYTCTWVLHFYVRKVGWCNGMRTEYDGGISAKFFISSLECAQLCHRMSNCSGFMHRDKPQLCIIAYFHRLAIFCGDYTRRPGEPGYEFITYYKVKDAWPWLVYIKNYNGTRICSGVIIHKKWILTAGYCFLDGNDELIYDSEDLGVELAVRPPVDIYSPNYRYNQDINERSVAKLKVYGGVHNYTDADGETRLIHWGKDIALIEVGFPYDFSDRLPERPICLSKKLIEKSECYIVGHIYEHIRRTQTDKVGELAQTRVKFRFDEFGRGRDCGYVANDAYCVELMGWNKMYAIGNKCQGDGGTPLVCTVNYPYRHFQLVGVSQMYLTKAPFRRRGCHDHANPYQLYTNVEHYSDWILKIISSD